MVINTDNFATDIKYSPPSVTRYRLAYPNRLTLR